MNFLISDNCLNLWNCKYVNNTKGSAYKTIFPQITQDNQTHKHDSVSIFRLRIGHWWLNIFHYYLFTFGLHPRDCVIIVKPQKQSVKFVTICSTYHFQSDWSPNRQRISYVFNLDLFLFLKRKAVTHLVENFITDSGKQRSLISQHTHLQKNSRDTTRSPMS